MGKDSYSTKCVVGKRCEYLIDASWDEIRSSFEAQLVKNLPAMRETWVQSLGWEDLLEKLKAIHSRILAWRIPAMRSSGIKSEKGPPESWGQAASQEFLTIIPRFLLSSKPSHPFCAFLPRQGRGLCPSSDCRDDLIGDLVLLSPLGWGYECKWINELENSCYVYIFINHSHFQHVWVIRDDSEWQWIGNTSNWTSVSNLPYTWKSGTSPQGGHMVIPVQAFSEPTYWMLTLQSLI